MFLCPYACHYVYAFGVYIYECKLFCVFYVPFLCVFIDWYFFDFDLCIYLYVHLFKSKLGCVFWWWFRVHLSADLVCIDLHVFDLLREFKRIFRLVIICVVFMCFHVHIMMCIYLCGFYVYSGAYFDVYIFMWFFVCVFKVQVLMCTYLQSFMSIEVHTLMCICLCVSFMCVC